MNQIENDPSPQKLLFLAKGWMQELHTLALHCQQGTGSSKGMKLPTVLANIDSLHQLVRCFLLQQNEPQQDYVPACDQSTAAGDFTQQLQRWRKDATVSGITLHSTAESYAADRQRQLQLEVQDLAAAAGQLNMQPTQQERLERIVWRLRELEGTPDFQARLLHHASSASNSTGYTPECFAYASTPFASWCQVMSHPDVAAAAAAALAPLGRQYSVWGSSTGWLLAYAALAYGWRCQGVELLPYLVEVATEVAAQEGLEGQVQYTCADLLNSDIRDVGVLVMADQCWDVQLQRKAALKAMKELPSPAVLISYNGKKLQQPLADRVERVVTVSAPVSWNQQQQWHVFLLT